MAPEDIQAYSQNLPGQNRRRSRHFVPSCRKDEYYWIKRQRNNEAARKSREKKKTNNLILAQKVLLLLQENLQLKKDLLAIKMKYNEIGPAEIEDFEKRMMDEETLSEVAHELSLSNCDIPDNTVKAQSNDFDLSSTMLQEQGGLNGASGNTERFVIAQSEAGKSFGTMDTDEPKYYSPEEPSNQTEGNGYPSQHLSPALNERLQFVAHPQIKCEVTWMLTSQPQAIKLQDSVQDATTKLIFSPNLMQSNCAKQPQDFNVEEKTSEDTRYGINMSESPFINNNLVNRAYSNDRDFGQYPLFSMKQTLLPTSEWENEPQGKGYSSAETATQQTVPHSYLKSFFEDASSRNPSWSEGVSRSRKNSRDSSSPDSCSSSRCLSPKNATYSGENHNDVARHLPYKLRFKLATMQSQS